MTAWSRYLKERLNQDSIVTPEGFIVYSLAPPICTINDLYIEPEFRECGFALGLTQAVAQKAREAKCGQLWTQVGIHSVGAERSLQIQFDYGFKMIKADNDYIMLMKELGE